MSDSEDTGDRSREEADAERADADAERMDIEESTTGEATTNESATDESTDSGTTVKTPTSQNESRSERATSEDASPEPTTDYATEEDVATLREDVAAFAEDLEERTVERDDLESDLRRYVRGRIRRNHARGWGPYLVLLYGTAMTIAAFYSPHLGGGWAILAMLVIWLSTLGLYALFVIVGLISAAFSVPGRLRDWVGSRRS